MTSNTRARAPRERSLRFLEPRSEASGPATAHRPGHPTKLSILMPVYNEERTLSRAIDAVLTQAYPIEVELCVVDDGSTDASGAIIDQLDDPRVRIERHPRNLGKGAALLTAAAMATGTHMVPFDADLEYLAEDLPRMLAPIIAGRCDVVFGTRLFGVNTRYQSYQQALGNRALTTATNVLFNAYLADVHTCLKMMPLPLFRALGLRESRFGLDAELTAKILALGIRPFEVSVSYYARSVADGKKINWRDGVTCLRVIVRVRRAARLGIAQSLSDGPLASSAFVEVAEIQDAMRERAAALAPAQ